MFEQVIIQGNLGRDAAMRSDTIVFSVAVNQPDNQPPVWYTVNAPAAYHANLLPYLKRGQPVFVVGKPRTYTYERDGITRSALLVHAFRILLVGNGSPTRRSDDNTTEPPDDHIPF